MISNKIKALIKLKGFTQVEIATHFGIIPQQLNRKISKSSFTLKDLMKLAEVTNTRLAFIDDKGQPIITFDQEDIEKA